MEFFYHDIAQVSGIRLNVAVISAQPIYTQIWTESR